MDINYESYKVFYLVATTLSFSEASKRLYISQSAVSQSVKGLEKKLGQPLFIRSTKNVQLTPAGQLLLNHIEPAINLIRRGENRLFDNDLGMGQLHIGASDTICRYFLVPYFQKFHQKFPNVPIKVTNATSLSCVSLLEQETADLIVTNLPNSKLPHAFIKKIVCEFHDVFIANPNYYAFPEQTLAFEDLKQYPLLMLNKKSATSEFLHSLFLKRQLELLPDIELNSNDLLIDLARIGLGIAFVPDYCLNGGSKDLIILNTKEPIPPRQIAVSVHTSLPISASAEEFLKLLPEA